MTNLELFTAMSDISTENLCEAEELQSKRFTHRNRPRAMKRSVLVAALIGVMLLLVGCGVAYVLRLQDLIVGERMVTQPVFDEDYQVQGYEDVKQNVMSVTGLKGTVNYRAAAEWYAFEQEFDPNYEIQNDYYSRPDSPTFPEKYDAYHPYAQEMVDKLEELSEKYGLKLLGALEQYRTMEEFLQGTGLDRVLNPASAFSLRFQNGHRYSGGNFGFVFELEPVDGTEDWPPLIWGTMQYYKKDYLDTRFWIISDSAKYEDWNFTTASGRDVLVVYEPAEYGATIFCDREDATIELTISSLQKPMGDVDSQELTRQQLEKCIDSFDFEIMP